MPPKKKGKGKKLSKKQREEEERLRRLAEEEERQRLEAERREAAARLIQRIGRGYMGRNKARQARAKRAEEESQVPVIEFNDAELEALPQLNTRVTKSKGVAVDDCLFFFGGRTHGGRHKEEGQITNQMWSYDTGKRDWKLLRVGGTPPLPCDGHTIVRYGMRLVLFGGQQAHGLLSDVYIYDTEMMSWDILNARNDKPPARALHAATIIGSNMYVFGGQDANGACFNDLWCLDLVNREWVNVLEPKGEDGEEDSKANGDAEQLKPSPRCGCTLTLLGDTILVFGGRDEGKNTLGDVWSFSIGNKQWVQINPKGKTKPPAREGHSALSRRNNLVVFAGWDQEGPLADMYSLSLDTLKWSVLRDMCPVSGDHTSVEMNPNIVFILSSVGADRTNVSNLTFFIAEAKEKIAEKPAKMAVPVVECPVSCSGSATLGWLPPPQEVVRYKLERLFKKSKNWKVVYEGEDTKYSVDNLFDDDGYKYRITAYNTKGWGAPSEEVFIKRVVAPGKADQLRLIVDKIESTTAAFHWSEPRQLVDKYILYIRDLLTPDGVKAPWNIAYEGHMRNFVVEHLFNNTKYQLKVVAQNGEGAGPDSEVVEIKTKQQEGWQPPAKTKSLFHRPWTHSSAVKEG